MFVNVHNGGRTTAYLGLFLFWPLQAKIKTTGMMDYVEGRRLFGAARNELKLKFLEEAA